MNIVFFLFIACLSIIIINTLENSVSATNLLINAVKYEFVESLHKGFFAQFFIPQHLECVSDRKTDGCSCSRCHRTRHFGM